MSLPIICIDRYAVFLLQDTSYPAGGAAVQLLSWIAGLLAEGTEVYLVCDHPPEDVPPEFKDLKYLSMGDTRGSGQFIAKLGALLDRPRAIIYQSGAGYLTGIIAWLCLRYNHFFLHRLANDADTDQRLRRKLSWEKRLLYRWGVHRANLLLCQNEYQMQQCAQLYPAIVRSKLVNPYKQFLEKPDPVPYEERSYFGWAGIFQYQKNLPLFRDIVRANPDIPFHLAGKTAGNADQATLHALEELKSMSNITWRGFLDRHNLIHFMQNAIGLINTSRYEGFSNTYLEAFHAGTPVIANTNANPDTIIGRFELGVVAERVGDYTNAIKKISEHSVFNRLSANCRNYVKKHHDHQELAKELINILSNMTS